MNTPSRAISSVVKNGEVACAMVEHSGPSLSVQVKMRNYQYTKFEIKFVIIIEIQIYLIKSFEIIGYFR